MTEEEFRHLNYYNNILKSDEQKLKDLRDQFAMAALAGWLGNPSCRVIDITKGNLQQQAKGFYEMADAMIEERRKQNEKD